MKKVISAVCLLLLLNRCYKESDYRVDSDKSKNLFELNVDKMSVLADSFSIVQVTVVFDNSVDSAKAFTTFKTSIGSFVESNSTTFQVKPKYNYDSLKLISTVRLKSSIRIDSTVLSVEAAGFTKSIVIKFNKSYPDFSDLSASTLSVKPKSNQEGEVTFTNKISKTLGFPSIFTIVDLKVEDTLANEIGSFRSYINKSDANGTTSYIYVLGDSIANRRKYTGRLYAISKVQVADNPLDFIRDTIIFISSN